MNCGILSKHSEISALAGEERALAKLRLLLPAGRVPAAARQPHVLNIRSHAP